MDKFGDKELLNLYVNTLDEVDSMNYRNKVYYSILYLWLKNKLNNKNIEDYFLKNKIKTIAVYGAGNLGELLYDELKNSNKVYTKYLIDQGNVNKKNYQIPIIKLEQLSNMEEVDCIVVTPIYAYDQIKENLSKLGLNKIMCIDDIVTEIYYE
ncbi:hypothetical protein [Clostridium brassicae]|uniref:C-methyltransferase domain-containing protein n=1 Tax=Clostridium brassicae TaxID=2999072 RepID=A0ABT4DBA0_9CLOT|nr:hypothetical protein [Clostridium brassicae]MCY6959576.1 hypothetical protein [Clostridium brassicae]